MIRIAPLLPVGCVAAAMMIPGAGAQADDHSFEFAARDASGWRLHAFTQVAWPGSVGVGQPVVGSVDCRGESRDFSFSMDGAGELRRLRPTFLGPADQSGDRDEITVFGDRLWLYVDGERWEYANIPLRRAFLNIDYPEPGKDEIVTGGWRGHQAVRRGDGQPWLHLSRLYERLIAAKRISWGFKSRDWTVVDRGVRENELPEAWQTSRYPIDNAGLKDAILWCARQVASDAAYLLPERIRAKAASTPAR